VGVLETPKLQNPKTPNNPNPEYNFEKWGSSFVKYAGEG